MLLPRGADKGGHKVISRFPDDVHRRVELADLALVHHNHPVSQLDGLGNIMGDKKECFLQAAVQPEQFILKIVPGYGVNGAERLIQKHDFRIHCQRAGKSDPLLLAAGKLPWVAGMEEVRFEANQAQQFLHPRRDAPPVPPEQLGDRRDVPGHGHVRKQARLLEPVMASIGEALDGQLKRRAGEGLTIEAFFFSNQYGILGKTPGAERLLALHRAAPDGETAGG